MQPISGTSGMTPAELQEMRKSMFQQADGDGNGSLNLEEITASLGDKGISADKAEQMFTKVDIDGNGEVTQAEYDQAFEDMKAKMASMVSLMQNDDDEESEDPVTNFLNMLNQSDEDREEMKELLQEEQRITSDSYSQNGTLAPSQFKNLINLTA